MSGSTLSRELRWQAPHYLWQTPHPATHSPQPCRHSALGVTATPESEGEEKARGGLHHMLATLLTSRLPALAAAILPKQQQHTSITWISISDDSVSPKAKFIKAAVAQVWELIVCLLQNNNNSCYVYLKQYKDSIFQDKRNHASGRPTVVAYCSDENFYKVGVVSAFGAKVSHHFQGAAHLSCELFSFLRCT